MNDVTLNPAEQAAQEAQLRIHTCIDKSKSFLLEAGAGAGKTYSLVEALKYLIEKRGPDLLRRHQRVACITYTNVAVNQIETRTDRHPVIQSCTIHAFSWSLIKSFQAYLRNEVPKIDGWSERLTEAGGIGTRRVDYDELGHRAVDETHVSLNHNDVLALTAKLMGHRKFRMVLASRYPVLFIDEYQDTDEQIAEALKTHFLDTGEAPLIGFFGDHWQKIYGNGCGKIEHPSLEVIGKGSNFRSVPVIVECLNRMRPGLPQQVEDPNAAGFVAVYYTNDWVGERRRGQHWAGDLPPEVVNAHLELLQERLAASGWDFSPDKTKILMLTHRVLAARQGYENLAGAFEYNEAFIKKEDPHIAYFVEEIEPVCAAYEGKRFGEMFAALGRRTPAVQSHADKVAWANDMNKLLELRSESTVGAVLDHLKRTRRPRLPETVERRELELERAPSTSDADEPSYITSLRKLHDVAYREVIALTQFINEKTPFSTKHGVKGAEFENVLVVAGRGWGHYNFNQFLEWHDSPPPDRVDAYERNRNLFYVVCSRPRKRLAILFTQKLSDPAMATLAKWFGSTAIHALKITG